MNDGSYLVALKASGADQYMIWNTDSSGNYVSSVLDPLSGSGVMSGSNIFLQLQEISFQQDLNSDFMIGPAILSPGLVAGGDAHGEVTLANLIASSSIVASSGGDSAGTINSCFSQLVQAMASYSAVDSATSFAHGINDPGLQNPMTIASHQ